MLRIANHHTVTRLLERLQANHVRFQYRIILVPGRAVHSLQEHHAIVNAVAPRDADAAEAAMRQHLAHSAAGPGARVAVELSAEAARALVDTIQSDPFQPFL